MWRCGCSAGGLRGQAAEGDEFGDQRVVRRDLAQVSITQQVRPAVADVAEVHDSVFIEDGQSHRGAHAAKGRIGRDGCEHGLVGGRYPGGGCQAVVDL